MICALVAAVAANPPQYKPAVYKAEPEPEYAPAPPAYRAPAAYKPAYPKNVDYEVNFYNHISFKKSSIKC